MSIRIRGSCPKVPASLPPEDLIQFPASFPLISIPFSNHRQSYFFWSIDKTNRERNGIYISTNSLTNELALFTLWSDTINLTRVFIDAQVTPIGDQLLLNTTVTFVNSEVGDLSCYPPIIERVTIWRVPPFIIVWSCEEGDAALFVSIDAVPGELKNVVVEELETIRRFINVTEGLIPEYVLVEMTADLITKRNGTITINKSFNCSLDNAASLNYLLMITGIFLAFESGFIVLLVVVPLVKERVYISTW